MAKDSETNKVQLAHNSPYSSQPESSGASTSNRWSILDSVAQQLDNPKATAPSLAESTDQIAESTDQAIPRDAAYPSRLMRDSTPAPAMNFLNTHQPSRAPAAASLARHGEAKTPPLILRFSAPQQGVTDHPGSTPLRDLLRRIAQ